MKPKALPTRRERFAGDRQQEAQELARVELVRLLNAIPFLKGGHLVSVKLTLATDYALNHGLGVPAACFLIRANYDGTGSTAKICESSTTFQAKLDQTKQLGIRADVSCTVDLWVYPRASVVIPHGASQEP